MFLHNTMTRQEILGLDMTNAIELSALTPDTETGTLVILSRNGLGEVRQRGVVIVSQVKDEHSFIRSDRPYVQVKLADSLGRDSVFYSHYYWNETGTRRIDSFGREV